MATDDRIAELERRVEHLTHQMGILQDTHEVRCLQFKYGYYLDKCLYDEVVALFADDCEVHFLGGIFRGKPGARRLYLDRFRKNFTAGVNGPVYGFLLDHPMLQEIVDIAPDRKTAKARLRCMMMAGRHESAGGQMRQWWEGALYENSYVNDNGTWKIRILNYRPVWHADFDSGWAHTRPQYVPFYTEKDKYPENPIGPDAIEDPAPVLWPDTDVLPFHYPHPITGKFWTR